MKIAIVSIFILDLYIILMPSSGIIIDILSFSSMALSIVIICSSLIVKDVRKFVSFPMVVLCTTVFRLSLEICTTRAILSHGAENEYAAGHIVSILSKTISSGSLLVGTIIFVTIFIVNLIVIAKGTARISEVYARFSLDSMPGKQMAIDAELASGSIDLAEAKTRRSLLDEESTFFASMDGVSKFVKGDSIASILIVFTNLICGVLLGIVVHKMNFDQALKSFSLLSMGDGLISQIPSLLVSISSGVIITRFSSKGDIYKNIESSLNLGIDKIFFLVLFSSIILSLIFSSIIVGVVIVFLYFIYKKLNHEKPLAVDHIEEYTTEEIPLETPISSIVLNIGNGIAQNIIKNHQEVKEKFSSIRNVILKETGINIDQILLKSNDHINEDLINIEINGEVCRSFSLPVHSYLLMDHDERYPKAEGLHVLDPAFNRPAVWITAEEKDVYDSKNISCFDASSVFYTAVMETIKNNIHKTITYAKTKDILLNVPKGLEDLCADIIPSKINIIEFQNIIKKLLEEHVNINNIERIIESIYQSLYEKKTQVTDIVATIRVNLANQINYDISGGSGLIKVVHIGLDWDQEIEKQKMMIESSGMISPSLTSTLDKQIKRACKLFYASSLPVVFLSSSKNRIFFSKMISRICDYYWILSYDEIGKSTKVESIFNMSPKDIG